MATFLQHCRDNNLWKVENCQSQDADSNTLSKDGLGRNVVHWVSLEGRSKCLRILADTGRVDWNRGDRWGCTPLSWALYYGHSDCVEIIVQQPDVD